MNPVDVSHKHQDIPESPHTSEQPAHKSPVNIDQGVHECSVDIRQFQKKNSACYTTKSGPTNWGWGAGGWFSMK